MKPTREQIAQASLESMLHHADGVIRTEKSKKVSWFLWV